MLTLAVPRDNVTVLGAGIYEWDGTPSHIPLQYSFTPYSLVGTYCNSSAEEVAARLIALCQDYGDWVIISYDVLLRMARHEYESGMLFEINSRIEQEYSLEGKSFETALRSVIDSGLAYLHAHGFIRIRYEEEMKLIELTEKFFAPIEGRVIPTFA